MTFDIFEGVTSLCSLMSIWSLDFCLDGLSVIIPVKGGKLHFHAPIGALVSHVKQFVLALVFCVVYTSTLYTLPLLCKTVATIPLWFRYSHEPIIL